MRKEISENLMSSGSKVDKERNYWLKKLAGELVKTNFPYDFKKPAGTTYQKDRAEFRLPEDLVAKLNRLTNRSDHNLYTVLMAGLILLLHKYSYKGNGDIIIGAPIYKQPMEGNFLNTVLAIRNRFSFENTFKELIFMVKKNLVEANENMNYPLERLLYHLDIPKSAEGFSLFETVILLENIHERKYIRHIHPGILFSFLKEGERSIEGAVEYDAALYREETIQRVTAHLIHLLQAIDKIIDKRIDEIEILSEEERFRLLHAFNDTAADNPKDKSISRLFEEQVEKTPGNTAVIGEQSLTYKELKEKSNRLARLLKEKGIKPGDIAAIMVEPSIDMIIGILGILKAGGAYLPIDPDYPEDRVKYMLEDSNAKILLSGDCEVIDLCKGEPRCSPGVFFHHFDLSYVIYTSGTTGKPKGVMLTDRNLVNYTAWLSGKLGLTPEDRTVLTSSFAFDLGYTAVYGALLNGGQLHLVSREHYIFAETLLNYIKENKITFLKLTPALFSIMVNSPEFSLETCASLRVVLLGGEPIIPMDVEEAHRRCTHLRVMNHYGPTEATIGCIAQFIDFHRFETYKETPTLGKPIRNTCVYILGKDMKPMPIGAGGELCISGDGLAQGYLNRPELTAEKFDHDLWDYRDYHNEKQREHKKSNKTFLRGRHRIYKSGDLGRWLPDGNIEFLGRIDEQVKIRGFRIELGEIENRLLQHEEISETVVIVRTDQNRNKFLCAYIVPSGEIGLDKYSSTLRELRDFLSQSLPEYMLPSYFIPLASIPLTPNGKVDRHALPEPKAVAGADYVPPQSETGEALAEVWQGVFGVERVGINDNFFEMGGDSIKAIQVSARLLKAGLKVEVRDLFTNPTIKELEKCVGPVERVIDQGAVEGEVPLTPVQHWFFAKNFIDKHHFNLAVMVCREHGQIDETLVEKVLTKIAEHHDVLRMVYKIQGDGVVQVNRGVGGKVFHLEVFRLEEELERRIEAEANRIQRSIDLEKGPLLKAGLFKTPQGDHLLLVIHHLVVDGVSWRILLEDFSLGYQQAERGEEIKFQDKTDSFKYWSLELEKYANSKDALKEMAYWKGVEASVVENLPKDRFIGAEEKKIKNNKNFRFYLTENETRQLLTDVHRVYNTDIKDILLAALGMAIHDWAGKKAVVNLEGHGRESLIKGIDVSRTVGWFTSHFPVVLDIEKTDPLSVKIKKVKELLRRIPDKGAGYGVLKYLVPDDKKQGIRFGIEPEINFNYLGQFNDGTGTGDEVFRFSPMSMGDIVSPESGEPYTFDISGMVVEDKLMLSISYNSYEYEKATVANLSGLFRENLLDIIRHCTGKEDNELTPSDVGDEELTLEELTEIEEMIHLEL